MSLCLVGLETVVNGNDKNVSFYVLQWGMLVATLVSVSTDICKCAIRSRHSVCVSTEMPFAQESYLMAVPIFSAQIDQRPLAKVRRCRIDIAERKPVTVHPNLYWVRDSSILRIGSAVSEM